MGHFMVIFLLITASSDRKLSCINSKIAQPIDTEFGVPPPFSGVRISFMSLV